MNAQATPEIRADRKTTRVTQGKRTLSEINAEIDALSALFPTIKDPNELQRAFKAHERLIEKRGKLTGKDAKPPSSQPGDDMPDTTMAQPKPTEAMFHGLVGDVANAAAENTEVNRIASAANFLSLLGAMAGRDVYYPVGDSNHHARLFTLHVGRTSFAGKGDALKLVWRILIEMAANENHAPLLGKVHSGGLSSREGLAYPIHDGYTQDKKIVEPIHDKRLWVVEDEFANVLQQGKRDGNTLSSALRNLWDGRSIQPLVKGCKLWATDPHVGIAAGISPGELHSLMHARDLTNGFANRFLMFWAERTTDVDHPAVTPKRVVAGLAGRTAEVIRFALGDYPNTKDSRPMAMSHDAREFYSLIYPSLRKSCESELLSTLLARRAPYVIRLGMLFALCDHTLVIEKWHLESALAWVTYSSGSVRYLFANQAREEKFIAAEQMAGKIAEFLKGREEWASLSDIYRECFHSHVTAQQISEVLTMMLAEPDYRLAMQSLPRLDGKPGRPRKVYGLVETCSVISLFSVFSKEPSNGAGYGDTDEAYLGEYLGANSPYDVATPDLIIPNCATEKTAQTPVDVEKPNCANYAINSGNDFPEPNLSKTTKGEL